jgi:hypothetical protein
MPTKPATLAPLQLALLAVASGAQQLGGNRHTPEFGLLVDLKPPPSLGVSTVPSFSWIVPTSPALSFGQRQGGFRIVVSSATNRKPVWDSGWVGSGQQSHVQCGTALQPAAKYSWALQLNVTDSNGEAVTAGSNSATFVTTLGAWSATPIWAAQPSPQPPTTPPNPHPKGRFIKPTTDYPGPTGLPDRR